MRKSPLLPPSRCPCLANITYYDQSTAGIYSLGYDVQYGNPDAFFAYRISPFAYAIVGIALTLLIGYPMSLLIKVKLTKEQQRMAYALTFAGRNEGIPRQNENENGEQVTEKEMMVLNGEK